MVAKLLEVATLRAECSANKRASDAGYDAVRQNLIDLNTELKGKHK